jgi:DNA-binding MarR family transcriptional regulator
VYDVKFIITPIDYIASYPPALATMNQKRATELSDLHISILTALYRANKGIRRKTLMKDIRARFNEVKFWRALTRMLELEYIIKTDYRRSVYYSITMAGRAVVDELANTITTLASAK